MRSVNFFVLDQKKKRISIRRIYQPKLFVPFAENGGRKVQRMKVYQRNVFRRTLGVRISYKILIRENGSVAPSEPEVRRRENICKFRFSAPCQNGR